MDIWEAAERGDLERVRAIVEHDAGSNQAQDAMGRTPLLRAACGGYRVVVLYLLDAGADIEHRAGYGVTALHWACIRGHAGIVSLLLQRGADVSVTDHGTTALMLAATLACDAIVHVLLERDGNDVDAVENDGKTALHRACITGRAIVVRQLLEAGADATQCDASGRTAMHLAAQNGPHNCHMILQEWHRAYTFYRARSVREASIVIANSSAAVDAAPTYLVERATSGLTMPTVHVSTHQQHGQPSDAVGEERHAEVGPVAVGGVVTVYAIEELNGEVFVELMELMGITGLGVM